MMTMMMSLEFEDVITRNLMMIDYLL